MVNVDFIFFFGVMERWDRVGVISYFDFFVINYREKYVMGIDDVSYLRKILIFFGLVFFNF